MNRLSWSGRWLIDIWHHSDRRVWRPERRPARRSPRWVPVPVGPMSNCSDSSGSTKLASTAATATGRTGHWRGGNCWPNWCRRRSGGTAPDSAEPTLHIVDGNRAGALRAITEASRIGDGIVEDVERLGLELDGRVNVLLLWPGHDDRAGRAPRPDERADKIVRGAVREGSHGVGGSRARRYRTRPSK